MVFAKEFKRLVKWRIAFMDERVQALLSCRHSSYGVPSSKNHKSLIVTYISLSESISTCFV